MKVVHVSPSYCRQDGGPSEVLRGLLPALAAAGADVTLVTTDKGLSPAERVEPPIVADMRVLHSRGPYSLTYAAGFGSVATPAFSSADVVHVHGVDNYVSTWAMRLASSLGLPFVVEPHGAWDTYHRRQSRVRKYLWDGLVQRRWLRNASGVVVSSRLELDQAAAVFGVAPIFTVPLGIDPLLFVLDGDRRSPNKILFLGRLAAKKRLDLALGAFAVALDANPALELTVVGPVDSDLAYDPARVAGDLGIASRVRFMGQATREQRLMLMEEHGVFLAPSDDESFGMAAAEAVGAGMRVVATPHVGAIAELQDLGLISTADSPTGLASLILGAGDAALRERARAHARANWTWEASASKLADVYSAVLR